MLLRVRQFVLLQAVSDDLEVRLEVKMIYYAVALLGV